MRIAALTPQFVYETPEDVSGEGERVNTRLRERDSQVNPTNPDQAGQNALGEETRAALRRLSKLIRDSAKGGGRGEGGKPHADSDGESGSRREGANENENGYERQSRGGNKSGDVFGSGKGAHADGNSGEDNGKIRGTQASNGTYDGESVASVIDFGARLNAGANHGRNPAEAGLKTKNDYMALRARVLAAYKYVSEAGGVNERCGQVYNKAA